MREQVLRAYKFALDPTREQVADFTRHAGAARWAYNWAHGQKLAVYRTRRAEIADLVAAGHTQVSAKMATTTRVPNKTTIQKSLNTIKGDSRRYTPDSDEYGPHRPCPWWHMVSTYALQSAMDDCDTAWRNWARSLAGQRAGRPVNMPRFKRKGRSRDAFRLYGAALRPDGYRRLILPRIGSVRLHESNKRLARLLERGRATLKYVSVARSGTRWYASVLAEVAQDVPQVPTRRQRGGGTVGVDLGVRVLATLSRRLDAADPASDTIANPKWLDRDLARLTKAQRRHARTDEGSRRRAKAAQRVGAIHARVTERRRAHHHQVTKRLVTGFAVVGVENLGLSDLTASAAGSVEAPGMNVRVKAQFNRHLLDAALGEFGRQLVYKARWYGSTVIVLDRGVPTNRICSSCGWENPPLPPRADWFTCGRCGVKVGRAVNSARNVQRSAQWLYDDVASDRGETKNARGADPSDGTAPTVGACRDEKTLRGHLGGAIRRPPPTPGRTPGRETIRLRVDTGPGQEVARRNE